jgi:hypothetical protein
LKHLIDDWVLLEILDSGYGNKNYRCMCGMPLRYQYIVLNKQNGQKLGLGETCFQNHTNLPAEVVKDIVNEFYRIDLFRNEIINKVLTGHFYDSKPYLHLENIPPLIKEQMTLGLPLTDKQISLLEQMKYDYDNKIRTEIILNSLKPPAKDFFETLPNKKKGELLDKLATNDFYDNLPDGFNDEEIEHYLSLGLPLLDNQIERIYEYNRYIKRKQYEERRAAEGKYWKTIHENTSFQSKSSPKQDTTITFESLMEWHRDTLKKVIERESDLSQGMKNDWIKIQNMVFQFKKGQDFDYSSFKLNLTMICYSLNLRNERYL